MISRSPSWRSSLFLIIRQIFVVYVNL